MHAARGDREPAARRLVGVAVRQQALVAVVRLCPPCPAIRRA
ncbi:hypothetical protein [Nonomuraea guangzhouensis]|nr:hypothetical protein [Nonomuraea guangzhouensis]